MSLANIACFARCLSILDRDSTGPVSRKRRIDNSHEHPDPLPKDLKVKRSLPAGQLLPREDVELQ
jgi:hypothetical protein